MKTSQRNAQRTRSIDRRHHLLAKTPKTVHSPPHVSIFVFSHCRARSDQTRESLCFPRCCQSTSNKAKTLGPQGVQFTDSHHSGGRKVGSDERHAIRLHIRLIVSPFTPRQSKFRQNDTAHRPGRSPVDLGLLTEALGEGNQSPSEARN